MICLQFAIKGVSNVLKTQNLKALFYPSEPSELPYLQFKSIYRGVTKEMFKTKLFESTVRIY